jgi:hypothetical protein
MGISDFTVLILAAMLLATLRFADAGVTIDTIKPGDGVTFPTVGQVLFDFPKIVDFGERLSY